MFESNLAYAGRSGLGSINSESLLPSQRRNDRSSFLEKARACFSHVRIACIDSSTGAEIEKANFGCEIVP